ncbi:DUF6003 family protein [Streptomyces cyaneofuscatus]
MTKAASGSAGPDQGRPRSPSAWRHGQESRGEVDSLEQELLTYGDYLRSRDDLIRRAKAAGITEVRIAHLTGHSRNTVRSALK